VQRSGKFTDTTGEDLKVIVDEVLEKMEREQRKLNVIRGVPENEKKR